MKTFLFDRGPYLEESKNSFYHTIIQVLIIMIAYRIVKEGMVAYWMGEISSIEVLLPILFIIACILLSYGCYYLGEHFLVEHPRYQSEESLIDGLLLGLLLPLHTPIGILVIAVFMTVFVGRYFYPKRTFFTPSLIGILSAFGCSIWFSLCEFSKASVIRLLFEYTEWTSTSSMSLSSLWLGFVGEWISKTSPILCFFALCYLIFKKAIPWRIPIYFIGSSFLLFLWYHFFIPITLIDIAKWFGTGNILFLAIFVATDRRTVPVTDSGQILFAIFLAFGTYYGSFYLTSFLAMIISLLILNLFTPLFDYFGNYYGLKYCS